MFYSKKNKRSSDSNHIKIKYLYAREKIKEGQKVIEHIDTEVMIVDPLTKSLTPKLFNQSVISVGMLSSFDLLG